MSTRRSRLGALAIILVAGVLAGCRASRVQPYARKATESDPRLSVRVPADTPDSEALPTRELRPRAFRAPRPGEVEGPDPRLACCPEGPEEFERNEVILFLGYTGIRAGDGATIGLGYERALSPTFGLSVFGEHVFGHSNVSVFGGGVALRPTERNKILLLAGVEVEHDGETEPLVRVGITHRIATWKGMAVTPAVYLDVVRDNPAVFLLGIELVKGW